MEVSMNQTIRVSVRQVYGRETLYPACKTALFYCRLAGTKTLTEDMVRLIRAQGITIEVEAPSIAFR
jgi:hypothetical protein